MAHYLALRWVFLVAMLGPQYFSCFLHQQSHCLWPHPMTVPCPTPKGPVHTSCTFLCSKDSGKHYNVHSPIGLLLAPSVRQVLSQIIQGSQKYSETSGVNFPFLHLILGGGRYVSCVLREGFRGSEVQEQRSPEPSSRAVMDECGQTQFFITGG